MAKAIWKQANFLGLRPSEARRLQPCEILELSKGEQEKWNRTCRLAGWMVMMIGTLIPRFSKGGQDWRSALGGDWDDFFSKYPPPGYVLDPKVKDRPVKLGKDVLG